MSLDTVLMKSIFTCIYWIVYPIQILTLSIERIINIGIDGGACLFVHMPHSTYCSMDVDHCDLLFHTDSFLMNLITYNLLLLHVLAVDWRERHFSAFIISEFCTHCSFSIPVTPPHWQVPFPLSRQYTLSTLEPNKPKMISMSVRKQR